MEKARNHDERKIQRHIEQAREALAVEDLSEAVKWVLKLHEPVRTVDPIEGINLQIYEVPLYKEAEKMDRRFKSDYSSGLNDIGQEIRRLAHSYSMRRDAGLVIVLNSSLEACDGERTLKNAGFSTRVMNYDNLFLDERLYWHEVAKAQAKLKKRDTYVKKTAEEILGSNPSLVLSPLFERFSTTEIQDNPLLQPEGVLIYRNIQERAQDRKIKFLGLSENATESGQWRGYDIEPVSTKRLDLLAVVKNALGISFAPYSLPQ